MKMLSADPGETTGFAIKDTGGFYSVWQVDSRSIAAIWQFLHDIQPDVILYEQFHYRPNMMKASLYSVQVIGVLRLYAETYNIPIPFTPNPDEAKAFWTDDKIKKLALWSQGKIHAMDALRVMMTYEMKTDIDWFQKILFLLKD